jgi:acyl carrier protein
MTEFEHRLIRCFSSVFPTLTEDDIRAADLEQLIDTDSLAGVTLVALIEQECGVEIGLEGLTKMRSFAAVDRYIRDQGVPSLLSRDK